MIIGHKIGKKVNIQILDDFLKSSDFRAKIEKTRFLRNNVSRKVLMLWHFLSFKSLIILSTFFPLSKFFSLNSIGEQQSTPMCFWHLSPKICPSSGPKFFSLNRMVYKWPKMKRLSQKICARELIRCKMTIWLDYCRYCAF